MGLLLDILLTPCECKSMNSSGNFSTDKYDSLGNKITSSNGDGPIYDDRHQVIGRWNCGIAEDLYGNRLD